MLNPPVIADKAVKTFPIIKIAGPNKAIIAPAFTINSCVFGLKLLNLSVNSDNCYVQEMFSYAAKTLSDEGIVTYEAVWEEAVNVLNRRKILKKDELNVMYELSHFNSYIDKNMQVQNLELSIERLKRINENVAMDIAPRMKICRIGGITAGVFIAIMLI